MHVVLSMFCLSCLTSLLVTQSHTCMHMDTIVMPYTSFVHARVHSQFNLQFCTPASNICIPYTFMKYILEYLS